MIPHKEKKMPNRSDSSIVEVVISVPPPPLSHWLRLAGIDVTRKGNSSYWKRSPLAKWFDDYEIILQLEGGTWIWCEMLNGSLEVRPGDLVFIPPHFTHAWHYRDEVHLYAHFDLHARPELKPYLMTHLTGEKGANLPVSRMPVFHLEFENADPMYSMKIPLITRLRMPDLWREKLDTLVRIYTTHAEGTLEAQVAIGETINWALATLSNGEEQLARIQSDVHPQITLLIQQMKDPRTRAEVERYSTESLARRAGMGETVFRAAFKAATGRNPSVYLVERRIEQAAGLLVNTDMRVQEIGKAVGYDDPYHFTRVFTKVIGDAPTHYRAKMRTALPHSGSTDQDAD